MLIPFINCRSSQISTRYLTLLLNSHTRLSNNKVFSIIIDVKVLINLSLSAVSFPVTLTRNEELVIDECLRPGPTLITTLAIDTCAAYCQHQHYSLMSKYHELTSLNGW